LGSLLEKRWNLSPLKFLDLDKLLKQLVFFLCPVGFFVAHFILVKPFQVFDKNLLVELFDNVLCLYLGLRLRWNVGLAGRKGFRRDSIHEGISVERIMHKGKREKGIIVVTKIHQYYNSCKRQSQISEKRNAIIANRNK